MSIALGGAAVGYADGRGMLDFIPTIGGSRMTTLAIAGWAATRFTRNSYLRAAGFAALAAGAYDFGRKQAGGASGWED